MIAAVSADDGILFQQLSNPVPVIQKFVVHGIAPVPGTERITRAMDVFGNTLGMRVERRDGGVDRRHPFQQRAERRVLAKLTRVRMSQNFDVVIAKNAADIIRRGQPVPSRDRDDPAAIE